MNARARSARDLRAGGGPATKLAKLTFHLLAADFALLTSYYKFIKMNTESHGKMFSMYECSTDESHGKKWDDILNISQLKHINI